MTPEQLDKWAAGIRAAVAKSFRKRGEIYPHAVALATVDPVTREPLTVPAITQIAIRSDEPDADAWKDEFAGFVRAKCREIRAMAVVLVSPGWSAADQGSASVRHRPDARKIIVCSFERVGVMDTKTWIAAVAGERRLAPFEAGTSGSFGRFANLLGNDTLQ